MRLDDLGILQLKARREATHHIQVRVSHVRDTRSEENPYEWAVEGEICRVFRSSRRRLECGERVACAIQFAVPSDAPLRDMPVGPIMVPLEGLVSARFVEVFLDSNLHVPDGQIIPVDAPTATPRMSPDDPYLIELAAQSERRRRRTQQLCARLGRVRKVVAQVSEEHQSDAFEPSSVSVFSCGDTPVVRVMLPRGHPTDLGSIRRLVKNERRLGHLSERDARIACTRHQVRREVRHGVETAVFLA
ncbi:MAG TPA: hypothetical protein VFY49_06590 [Myxococcota bacterium]|nr:hypothetical protein [Myxococcota bacterium]